MKHVLLAKKNEKKQLFSSLQEIERILAYVSGKY